MPWSIRRHPLLVRVGVAVVAACAVAGCSSDDSSNGNSVLPEQFQTLSRSAAASLTTAVAPGATKVIGTCPYATVFARFADLGASPTVTAANLDVNSPQTGGVDIVCESANAQIAVGTYDPKVLTPEILATEATSVTPTPYGSIYVFPKYIFQQPDKYVQYAWLLTAELFVGVAVPPPATPDALIERLTATAPDLVTLTVAVKPTDLT